MYRKKNVRYQHSNLNCFPSSTVLSCNGIVMMGFATSSNLIFFGDEAFSSFDETTYSTTRIVDLIINIKNNSKKYYFTLVIEVDVIISSYVLLMILLTSLWLS